MYTNLQKDKPIRLWLPVRQSELESVCDSKLTKFLPHHDISLINNIGFAFRTIRERALDNEPWYILELDVNFDWVKKYHNMDNRSSKNVIYYIISNKVNHLNESIVSDIKVSFIYGSGSS